jgi:phosphoenolpyruvate-protein phosphotransferase
MIILRGQGVGSGIAFGKLRFKQHREMQIEKLLIQDVTNEIDRYMSARRSAMDELEVLFIASSKKIGEENSLLFQIHQMLLEDDDYNQSIIEYINHDKCCAEYAVSQTSRQFVEMFSNLEDDYMKARAADIKDISERVIAILKGTTYYHSDNTSEEPYIIASDDLVPSETAQLDKDKVQAIIISEGAANSHTAIFANTMGIPAVIRLGNELTISLEGKEIAVDATEGLVYIEPDQPTLQKLQKKETADKKQRQLYELYKGKETKTRDGQLLMLYANIGNTSDVQAVIKNDAEGVGLFRSEFLFLEKTEIPTEEEQFLAYKEVVEKMQEKRVIIRTLDIGADKQVSYLNLPKEDNPALGMRAIRICLTQPELFKTQLRAIYRVSHYGTVAIMFPMITSVEEIKEIKQICQEVKDDLILHKIPFSGKVELGIMIETPAAALISDELAGEVDFFSIGTNDLIQYTLATDRQNSRVARFCDTHHKAVLRLIEMTVDNAHKAGIWVGICGELAADEALTETFLRMGIDELSVSPYAILELRARIAQL